MIKPDGEFADGYAKSSKRGNYSQNIGNIQYYFLIDYLSFVIDNDNQYQLKQEVLL